eukprot:g942.t1
MLSQYGQIGRIHFAAEDEVDFKERKRNGGCRQRGHVEGWVEFMDKKIAKKFVQCYNGQLIGGKRRSPFYEEIWCVKYLPGFKWDHLLEGIRCRKILMQQELQREMADAKKQQEIYLNRVEAAKRIEKSCEERKASGKEERTYSQKEPLTKPALDEKSPTNLSDELLILFGGDSD